MQKCSGGQGFFGLFHYMKRSIFPRWDEHLHIIRILKMKNIECEDQGRKIYLPYNRGVGSKFEYIEFESQFSEKSNVFIFFKSCNKLIS